MDTKGIIEMLTKEQIANREKWIKALRSGKYKQGKHVLHNPKTDRYCCLGVACDLFKLPMHSKEGWLLNVPDDIIGFYELFGLHKAPGVTDISSFVGANDIENMSFDEIADTLELMTLADIENV